MEQSPLRVAVLGCGSVGSEVVRLMDVRAADLAARVGAPLQVVGVAVRRTDRPRPDHVARNLLTTDAESLVARPDVDIVVEVIGGIEPARTLILGALRNGASVVTANKTLLAEDGPTVFDAAAEAGRDVYFEAAVAGAIPIVRPLKESLAGDRVRRVIGIVNGTTNYVLDQMDTTGSTLQEALEEAQRRGYAEADPTADIEGFDAASKAALLASLAFHTPVRGTDVYREGITAVSATDVAHAREIDHVVKLLAICDRVETDQGDQISIRVHPAMIPRAHPLAGVREAYNAVFVESDAAGELMFYGRGAGGTPSASAVLGDIVTVGRIRLGKSQGPGETAYANLSLAPMGATRTRYQVAVDVRDKVGVLATIATMFAEHGVSIQTVRQEGRGADAQLVLVTHTARDDDLAATVRGLRKLEVVRDVSSVMRVEGESDEP